MKTTESVLAAFPIEHPVAVTPLGKGRIHKTFFVETGKATYVLQHIGPLFVKTVDDIELVTTHLTAKRIETPRIIRTCDGAPTVPDDESAWRLMTFIPGTTVERASLAQAAEAARCVARFHTALLDYEKSFVYRIPGYRDTRADFKRLRQVSYAHGSSVKHSACSPIAEDILARIPHTNFLEGLPARVGHGDLKLNNIRFDSEGTKAVALIDLDTLGRYPLPLELGDMLRSACRTEHNTLDIDVWHTLMSAYQKSAHFMTQDEWRLIPDGFFEITLALAARYLTDAYEETWFKHDPTYPSLYEQNVARARMYLALLDEFTSSEDSLRALHV